MIDAHFHRLVDLCAEATTAECSTLGQQFSVEPGDAAQLPVRRPTVRTGWRATGARDLVNEPYIHFCRNVFGAQVSAQQPGLWGWSLPA
jgi:hypothetical protein